MIFISVLLTVLCCEDVSFVTSVFRWDSMELGSQAEIAITVFSWYLLMNIQ